MGWYIGIDGGGTKTAFCIGKDDKKVAYSLRRSGCSYLEIGAERVVELITEGVNSLLTEAGITAADCSGCCIGLPCYGENQKMDIILEDKLTKALAPIPVYIVNDGVVGWAGSLECGEGVHLVAGTGSMAFGKGVDDTIIRTGGWCEFFGDEGSCYWVGRQVMSLFSKQADGRVPKSALYDIIKADYNLTEDFEIIDIIINYIAPHREKVAAFQMYAQKAAEAGDTSAADLYAKAADELAQIVMGIVNQLRWSSNEVTVSYFGGLFKAGDLILTPLKEKLSKYGCRLVPPKQGATEGALLLAVNKFSK